MSSYRDRFTAQGEGGFMLIFVLATMLLLSIVGLAIASYTVTTSKVATSLSGSSSNLRAIDSSLEVAINSIRSSSIPNNGSCTSQSAHYQDDIVHDTFDVSCTDGAALNDERRILDLDVTRGSSAIAIGHARVKIVDKVFSTRIAGYSVEICDWQLGKDVSPTLAACPA